MAISEWPEHERPREKLLQRGPAALSDAELLAIFLRTGVPGKTAVDVARELLASFGGLRELLAADPEEICEVSGLGEAKYVQLQASLEIGRRFLAEKLKREVTLSSTRDTKDFLQAHLRDRTNEVFCVLFLDNRHRVLAFEELFQHPERHGGVPAGGAQARAQAQRRRRDPGAQPSFGRGRAEPGG